MSRKSLVLLAVLFSAALLLLFLAGRGYRELEAMQSLEKASAAVRREFPEARPIPTAQLAALLAESPDRILLVDARKPDEVSVGRIPGAVVLRDAEEVEARLAENAPASPATVIVYDSVGFRSARLAGKLSKAGRDAAYLDMGIFRWANEGRPLVDGAGNPTTKVHPYNKLWGRLLERVER